MNEKNSVNVYINKKKYEMDFDTGAVITTININDFNKLKLNT